MTAPSLGPTFGLHAAGKIDGATGALTDGVNILSVVRNGLGDYTVTLGSAIDATARHLSLTANSAGSLESDPAGNTDNSLQILAKDAAGAAADVSIDLAIFRTSVPS
jgi:hypothetical protein